VIEPRSGELVVALGEFVGVSEASKQGLERVTRSQNSMRRADIGYDDVKIV
jgi:hypothetical protein